MFDNNQQMLNAKADALIERFLFVKQAGSDDKVSKAGDNDVLLGVTPDYDVALDEGVPVVIGGVTQLQLGDTVTAGDRLKSDAAGKAVKIDTTGTVIQQVGAIALRSGVVDDPIPALIVHSSERPALV